MKKHTLVRNLKSRADVYPSAELSGGSRVAVMGGGPSGSCFSYFLLDFAQKLGRDIQVDIYEPRHFNSVGPLGCNMCGGIISESFVQTIAVEEINLPPTIIQQGIDSYILHMSEGSVRVNTSVNEAQIASVFRGAGPRDLKEPNKYSFDGHLQYLAVKKGACLINERVTEVKWNGDKPQIWIKDSAPQTYDLLAVAVGVNSPALRLVEGLGLAYRPPSSTKTVIREYHLGAEKIEKYLGNSMHVFLLDIPRLKFAAAIPKRDYITVALIGEEIDSELVQTFLNSAELRRCMPPDWDPKYATCQCSARMNVSGAVQPFGHRIVFIGDCGTNRLYKDGIGGGHRTAKAAASTAIFQGVSADAFRRHYLPTCRAIDRDNACGKFIFRVTRQLQRHSFPRRAVIRMTGDEQEKAGQSRRLSMVLWDTFSGSAPYRDILLRILRPAFLSVFLWNMVVCILPLSKSGI
jgi:flavin-dependent dehydrogenase